MNDGRVSGTVGVGSDTVEGGACEDAAPALAAGSAPLAVAAGGGASAGAPRRRARWDPLETIRTATLAASGSGRFGEDARALTVALGALPVAWDGRESVEALRRANNPRWPWRGMEWCGYSFEHRLAAALAGSHFAVPGRTYGNTQFDLSGAVDWDAKCFDAEGRSGRFLLNDRAAVDASLAAHGAFGFVFAACRMHKDGPARDFQQWHTALKGGESAFEIERIARGAPSRPRKQRLDVVAFLLLRVTPENVGRLRVNTRQYGRNSGGSDRNPKYEFDLRDLGAFLVGRFPGPLGTHPASAVLAAPAAGPAVPVLHRSTVTTVAATTATAA